jgi:nitronate monooxygenase
VSPNTKVWVQIGSVADAVDVVRQVKPDVLVVQGTDAGGHGLVKGAGIVTLFPEVDDAIEEIVTKEGIKKPVLMAAGGIAEKRGAAAALVLGAAGVVMGTRFLASKEAEIAKGYQEEVIRVRDGGQSTVRSKVYDGLRGTTGWTDSYNARGIINKSYTDALAGMGEEENKKLYEEAVLQGDAGWGTNGRMTAYAGVAVGLIKEVKCAAEVVKEVRDGAKELLLKPRL